MKRSAYCNLRFMGPFGFFDRTWDASAPHDAIVYRLRVWDADTGRPRPVSRAGGVDRDGILDIGESQYGRGRLRAFCCAAEGKLRSHRAGRQYAAAGYDFASIFAPETIRIEFISLGKKVLAEALEVALLEDYRWRFKDRPPLNGSDGKWRKVERWLTGMGRVPRNADEWLDLRGLLPAHAWKR